MTEPGPQVSWKAIERDAAVVSAEGADIARVVEIAGDRTADIFNGLVVTLGPLERSDTCPPSAWSASGRGASRST